MAQDRKKLSQEDAIHLDILSMFEENELGGAGDDYSLAIKEGLTLLDEESEKPLEAPPLRQSSRYNNEPF